MEKGKEEKKRGIDLPILLSKVRVALPACWDEGKLVLSHSVGLLTDMERERKIRESHSVGEKNNHGSRVHQLNWQAGLF